MTRFIPQYEPVVRPEYIEAVKKQMESGWVGCGKTVELFEDKLKEISGRTHVMATTSGTMALYLALSALEVPKDKKILFPAYTFLAGANVIKQLGYEVEFVDISAGFTYVDPTRLTIALSNNPDIGAVIYVEHMGNTYHTPTIESLCKAFKVPLIVDSAQSVGMKYGGAFGDLSIFSFSVPKLVTTGQGGAVLTNNEKLADKVKQLRDHGDNWRLTKVHNHIGLNLKFNDISAAYGLAQLNILDELVATRQNIFETYRKYLNVDIKTCSNASPWMITHTTFKADTVIDALKAQNIQAVKYYKPIPSNPAFGITKEYPSAKYVYDHCVYLPSSLNLTEEEIKTICGIVSEIENKTV